MSITKLNLPVVVVLLGSGACAFDSMGTGDGVDEDDGSSGGDADTDSDDEPDTHASSDGDDDDSDSGDAVDCDDPQRFYLDADGDGFGDPDESAEACEQPAGHVDNDLDCDDVFADVNPDALEACDGFDNDCDGGVDEFSTANTQCGVCTWDVGPGGVDAFAHCDKALTWEDARAACTAFGGDLAVVASAPVHAFVHELATGDPWIGLADRDEEGRWVWVDGQDAMIGGVSVGFDGWQSSQPDGAVGEDCGLLVQTKGWADADCSEEHTYACQLPL